METRHLIPEQQATQATTNPITGSYPGYMLAVDPYLATGLYQTQGKAVFAGLTDRPREYANGVLLDHDYQDMGVRISVMHPNPALWR